MSAASKLFTLAVEAAAACGIEPAKLDILSNGTVVVIDASGERWPFTKEDLEAGTYTKKS